MKTTDLERGKWEPALDLGGLRAGILHISGECAPQEGGIVDLTGAKVGVLLDDLIDKECYAAVLKGFEYYLIHGADPQRRLNWVAQGARKSRHRNDNQSDLPAISYDDLKEEGPSPQPFMQLAKAYERDGRKASARKALWRMTADGYGVSFPSSYAEWNKAIRRWLNTIRRVSARVVHLFRRQNTAIVTGEVAVRRGKLRNFIHWVEDATIGYGYKPWRAAKWLIVLWGIGLITFAASAPESVTAKPLHMSWVEHIIYPLDLIIPLVGFSEQARWHPTWWVPQLVAACLVISGWVIGATVIGAVSRVLRRG
ncbi:hypothetical protein [Streptomyces sp. SLBN-31]|uniref:hypothetical protein n=1 Tax=Streptomyces sp. SLBN-31 TaxID=2768444 RepID=UPI00114E622D|nr:hypothetical protein [Streptomyces sp. SLBN-31]